MTQNTKLPSGLGWPAAGLVVSVGGAVLLAGLLAGPTPGEEAPDALADIDRFRTRWVVTNAIDLTGAAVLAAGLASVARLLARAGAAPALTTAAELGMVVGNTLTIVVLIVQSTVDVGIASRYVDASGAEQATQLALGEAVLDLEGGVFGVGLLLLMLGVTCLALALWRGPGPRLNRGFVLVGAALALTASTTGVAFLVEPLKGFGRLEPFFALAALIWLIVLGVLLARARVEVPEGEPGAVSAARG